MQVAGIGRVIFWEGGSLWIGMAVAPTEWHAHHAVQVCMGLSGKVQFQTKADEDWVEYEAVVVPSDLPHTFQAPGKTIAHIFCEPESSVGRQIIKRLGRSKIVGLALSEAIQLSAQLARGFENGLPDDQLAEQARRALSLLSESGETATPTDPRVQMAILEIYHRLDEPIALDEIARVAGLSEGRFRHLFVAETGVHFRAFVLWARLNRALELGFGGTSWTEAAHAANFADSAHLTRTCRRMFGIAPSSLRHDETQTSSRTAA